MSLDDTPLQFRQRCSSRRLRTSAGSCRVERRHRASSSPADPLVPCITSMKQISFFLVDTFSYVIPCNPAAADITEPGVLCVVTVRLPTRPNWGPLMSATQQISCPHAYCSHLEEACVWPWRQCEQRKRPEYKTSTAARCAEAKSARCHATYRQGGRHGWPAVPAAAITALRSPRRRAPAAPPVPAAAGSPAPARSRCCWPAQPGLARRPHCWRRPPAASRRPTCQRS